MEKTKIGGSSKTLEKNLTKKLTESNKAVTTQKVIVHRELKYKYPKGCNDTLARKAFRQKVRNAMRKIQREIKKLKGDEKIAKKAELIAYKEEKLLIQ